MQPVAMASNEFWTDDFNEAVRWFRESASKKRIVLLPKSLKTKE